MVPAQRELTEAEAAHRGFGDSPQHCVPDSIVSETQFGLHILNSEFPTAECQPELWLA